MIDFDRMHFESLMAGGVQAQARGHHEEAWAFRTEAYAAAPEGSLESGRAARDISASEDKLGNYDDAIVWADRAYTVHSQLIQNTIGPGREMIRQHAVSAMYVGVHGLRRVISSLREGREPETTNALDRLHETESDLDTARRCFSNGLNRVVDQYDINATRRVSIGETLLGSRKRGISLGLKALALSPLSESKNLDTSDTTMTTGQRLRAKAHAFIGGAAALGVGLLYTSRPGKRQSKALDVASRVL